MTEKRFVDWIPVMVEHRPYDTESNVEPVGGCHGCEKCFRNGALNEYPKINRHRRARRVCDSCLEDDKKSGVFDAIMDIWNNYEEG